MEAGLEHLSRGTTKHVDTLLAVAEPYYKSLETARRVSELANELGIPHVAVLGNKVRDASDADALRAYAERHGLSLVGEIPYDEAVVKAEQRAEPLLDVARPDTPILQALDRLADSLVTPR
jgi:CO dehydrogenase maturation factor